MQVGCRFKVLWCLLLLGSYAQAVSSAVEVKAPLVVGDEILSEGSSQEIDTSDIVHRMCSGAIKPYLLTIVDEISGLQTCCEILSSKIDNITVSASVDLTPVTSQLDVCCSTIDNQLGVIESKIDNIHVVASADLTPVTSQLDVCCSTIDNQLGIIESKIDNITVSASVDLTPVTSKLDVCCSAIDNQLGIIESKIDNITVSASVDLTPVMSKLDVCCSTIDTDLAVIEAQNVGTRSVVDFIDSKIDALNVSADLQPVLSALDVCCSTIDADLAVIDSKIDANAAMITSQLEVIDSKIDVPSACSGEVITTSGNVPLVTPIMITGPVTITDPGYYCLAKDIQVAGANAITINADDVTLDLNNHTIDITTANDCIFGLNRSNITIKNGTLISSNATGSNGIFTLGFTNLFIQNCTAHNFSDGFAMLNIVSARVENSAVFGCSNRGFFINSAAGGVISISDCLAQENDIGFYDAQPTGTTVAQNCKAINNSTYGFWVSSSASKYYFANTAILNGATPAQAPLDTNYNVVFPYAGGAPFYWIVTPANTTAYQDNVTA